MLVVRVVQILTIGVVFVREGRLGKLCWWLKVLRRDVIHVRWWIFWWRGGGITFIRRERLATAKNCRVVKFWPCLG